MFQLSRLAPNAAKFAHKASVALEDLDSVILLITNVNESQGIRGDPPGVTELAIRGPLAAKRPEKVPGGIEDLNPVIVPIRNDVLSDPVDSNPGQAIEFAFSVSVASETELVDSIFPENLDPVI